MADILIYSKTVCPFCVKAKSLLDMLGHKNYTEINLSKEPEKLEEMLEKSNGARTVPQIFINSEHIGGCDDLFAVHEKGELVTKLEA